MLAKINSTILAGIVRRQPLSLDLSWTNLTSKQLSWLLPRLPQLQTLKLVGCKASTIGALQTCNCPLLTGLDLSWTESFCDDLIRCLLCKPSDSRPGQLESKTRLRYLSDVRLSGTLITDESLRHMNQNLPLIRKIDLSECHLITDSGIASLVIAKSDKLTELYMSGCSKITDVSLKLLRTCYSLEKLDVRQCQSITDEGCEKFLDPNHHYNDEDDQENNPHYSDQDSDHDDDDENIDRNNKQMNGKSKQIKSIVSSVRTVNNNNNHDGCYWQSLKERFFIKRRDMSPPPKTINEMNLILP
ncbi:hypothetical protein BLA29_004777 [Euroglyphus maynei]|uniref:Uncharacterized protein n=1 Tax=Euroglyphus maynei TaxID=6958 RepID=A0A1Y3AXS1_EURMA|nr:hypothetical protein BLA29_004777 [Euroglyphus maynei]